MDLRKKWREYEWFVMDLGVASLHREWGLNIHVLIHLC